MDPFLILNYVTAFSFLAFALIAKWHLLPKLSRLPFETALIALTWVHVFRYVALFGFLPGQLSPDIPDRSLNLIIYGDTISGLLAFVAVLMLRYRAPGAIAAVWIFNIFGFVDWAASQVEIVSNEIFQYELGAGALISIFYVPVVVITHVIMLYWLISRRARAAGARARPAESGVVAARLRPRCSVLLRPPPEHLLGFPNRLFSLVGASIATSSSHDLRRARHWSHRGMLLIDHRLRRMTTSTLGR